MFTSLHTRDVGNLKEREREEERETKVSPMNHNLMLILMNSYPILNALRGNFLGYNVLKYWGSHWPKILCRNLARWSWLFDAIIFWVSSQLVTWPTRNQVNLYPGSPLVTTMEKSTRNQSLGYKLTLQQLSTKIRTQTYSSLYQDI